MHVPRAALFALLILLTVIAYFPAVHAGFIWDDDLYLTANHHLDSARGLSEIWSGKGAFDYVPLTFTTFWLEKQFWGLAPAGYHAINILLHAISAVLLWRIFVELRLPGNWLAALLFAIHPVNVASVAWIAQRKNTLSAALLFASVLSFLLFVSRGRRGVYCCSIALFVLAGLSKGAVVMMPVMLIGALFWRNGKLTRRDLFLVAPFFLLALGIGALTIHFQWTATDYHLVPRGFLFRFGRAGDATWFYFCRLIFPIGLSPMAPQSIPNLRYLLRYLPAAGVLVTLGLIGANLRNWRRPLLFGFAFYLLLLLPVLGFVWMGLQQETPAADWWQYTAAPVIFALLAAGLVTLSRRLQSKVRFILPAMLCLVIPLLLMQTWRSIAIYRSMETYCRALVADDPHLWTLQNNLGVILKRRGEIPEAIAHYRQAIADNPRYAPAHHNLGNALIVTNDLPDAEKQFMIAARLRQW